MNSDPARPAGAGPAEQAGRRPTRRAVLIIAAAAGGAAATAAVIDRAWPPAFRGTTGRPASTGHGGTASRRPRSAGPAAADWAVLDGELSPALLVRPGEQGYGRARQLFDPRFDQLRPAGVAYCRSAADVSACLAFARRFALPVAARSGGHSYAGWSSGTGLIVDVTPMASFQADGDRVRVGTGIRLIDFYAQLAARGLAVPGGSCPTVGIAGLTLGGGVGVLGRALGLTCDNLTAAQIVTADGRLLDCDGRRNADLFWACRGGGGGNFGVATSLTFGAHRLSALTLFFLSWPWAQAAQVVSGWQSWAPYQGDELWSNLHLSAAPGTGVPLSVQVGGTFLGSPAEAAAVLEKLTAAVGSAPSGEPFELPYLDAMLAEAGCGEHTAGQCHLPAQAPGGRLARQPQFAKSDFVTRPLPPAGIAVLLAAAERFLGIRAAAQATGAIAFDACGGAINRVHPAATAFVHRDALFLIQYTTTWAAGSRGGAAAGGAAAGGVVNSAAARQRDWQHALHASMRPYVSGQAYQNYIDPGLAGWRRAYYGANYQRLARIKAAYDPGRLFRFPQGISPAR
jgi:FAD/FMN-containing dehydrogenase